MDWDFIILTGFLCTLFKIKNTLIICEAPIMNITQWHTGNTAQIAPQFNRKFAETSRHEQRWNNRILLRLAASHCAGQIIPGKKSWVSWIRSQASSQTSSQRSQILKGCTRLCKGKHWRKNQMQQSVSLFSWGLQLYLQGKHRRKAQKHHR